MRGDDVEERVEAAGRRHRRMRRAMTTTAAGAAALLVLSGCGPSEEELTVQAEEDQLAAPLEVAWESDDELISGVREAGGVALAYVRDGDLMQVVARDVDTGEELWREPALYGNRSNGTTPTVPVVERDDTWYASFYTTSDDGPGHHVVADVETGDPLRPDLTQEIFADRPEACGETFCAEGQWFYQNDGSGYFAESFQEVAFDFGSERWKPREETDEAQGFPLVTEDALRYGSNVSISSIDESGETMIGFTREGELAWKRPYAEVFGEDHSTGRHVTYSNRQTEDPLIMAAWGYPGQGGEVDLESLATAAHLDAETGETVWQRENFEILCEYGEYHIGEAAVTTGCAYEGGTRTVDVPEEGETTWEDRDVDMHVVALDAETGEELWTKDVGATAPGVENDTSIVGDRYMDVTTPGGEVVTLDMVSGEEVTSRKAYESTVFCETEDEPVEVERFSPLEDGNWSTGSGRVDVERYASTFPCDRDERTAVDEMPTVAELRRIGYEEESGVVVVRGRDGMVGYEIPALEEFREDA